MYIKKLVKTIFLKALKAFTQILPAQPTQQPDPTVLVDNQLLLGKNILITGAGHNIGRSIAIEMAKQGANIFFTDIDQQRCEQLEQTLKANPITAKGFLSNITLTQDIDSLCSFLIQNDIKIDALINNVGIQFEGETIHAFDLSNARQIFDTNLFGPLYLTKQIVQMFKTNTTRGSIIFITSIHQDTIRRLISYSASKAALKMIIEEMALELAPYSIRVNGIAPGAVSEDGSGNAYYHKATPLYQSTINPAYIGRAAVYLTSDYFSKFTTGAVIKIDAGLSLHSYLSL